MAKSIKGGGSRTIASRNQVISSRASSVLSQRQGKAYGISSDSKKATKSVTSSAVQVSSKMSATAASKVLRDGRYGVVKKSIAGSVLSTSKGKPKSK